MKVSISYLFIKDPDAFLFDPSRTKICQSLIFQAQDAFKYIWVASHYVLAVRYEKNVSNLKIWSHSLENNVRAGKPLIFLTYTPLQIQQQNLKRHKKQHLSTHGAWLSLSLNQNPRGVDILLLWKDKGSHQTTHTIKVILRG